MSYISDKNEELKILSGYSGEKKTFNLSNSKQFLKEKQKIVKKLRNFYFKKYYHELTNKDDFSVLEPFRYNYTYERFNGHIEIDDFASKFYKFDCQSEHYFASSGMSAISALLLGLANYNKVKIDLLHNETYFETIKILSNINTREDFAGRALYIDTIAGDFEFSIDEKLCLGYDFVVIDTTCFLPERFAGMIETIVKKLKKPCFLVRSHTKLDLLGTEFSHLGSVSLLYKKNTKNVEWAQKIMSDCKHLIGVIGACLPPERFPIFLMDKELGDLNKRRIERVSSNTEAFVKYMKGRGLSFSIPNHRQFCLYTFENHELTLDALKMGLRRFCSKNTGLNVYCAVSFGFDYAALDCYENFRDKKFKIRICLNDDEEKNILKIAEKFCTFVKSL